MGSKSGTRSSRLFLLEMMIAVLFFSLGSAVCIQAFVRAHTDSLRAQELAFSSSAVSSAANALRYGGQDLGEYLPGAVAQGEGRTLVYYDDSFAPCGEAEASYILEITTRREADVTYSDLQMTGPDQTVLYALSLHYPTGGAA